MTDTDKGYFKYFRIQIITPVVLTVILFVVAFFLVFLPSLEDNLMNKKQEMIRELVNSVWSILDDYEQQFVSGSIDIDDAKENAVNKIRNLRYGLENKDYFWITDYYPNMIMHPYTPELNGQSLRDYMDPNGKRLFVEFVKVVEKNGYGFVDYIWQWKDDPERLVPKLSYVRGFESWGWIIGTGIYLEDVKEEINSIIAKLTITLIGILSIVSLLLSHMIRQGFRIENARKTTHEKLIVSESKYRTIFENSGTTIMISEADMTVSLVNSEFEKLIGYSKEEFEGKRKWTELMHQDELEKMMQYHSLHRQDPSVIPKKYETRAYHKNGDIKNLYITVEMIPGTDKSVISIIDITRQKQTEEELLNEKNFSSNLVKFSPAFYIATDKNRKILMVNDPLMDATGYSLDDLIDKDFVTALVPDDHKEKASRLFNILITAKIAATNESVIRTADGRIIPVEWHRRIVFNTDGEIDYYINLGIDISERKKAESALIESEKKYRILAETAFAGIILLDENEVITYANPAFCDMAGSNFKEIANRKLSDVITIEDYENSIAYHKDETDSKNQYFESTLFRNDGSFLNVLISATPLLSAEDNFQGTLAVIVDITQMKKMEEEIAFSRNMSAIGELSRKIAHEIGNPLTSILNSANLLKRKVELEGSNERLMEIILKETKRLDSIILDFLKFSRTKKPVLKPCNIVTCINDQLLLLKNNDQFLSKKIDLKFTHWDTIPDIPLDIDLMKNVLWNLLINSIQAIDSEGIIHIEVFGEEKRGEFLNIAISDTGNGIDKKDMKKIFEPYFTTKSRGSGIGLSVVKKVVTDHTGFIEVSSKSGKGTSFIIKLPTYKRE